MNLNICSERNYENKSPIPSLRKQTQFSFSVGFGIWVLDLGICLKLWICNLGFVCGFGFGALASAKQGEAGWDFMTW